MPRRRSDQRRMTAYDAGMLDLDLLIGGGPGVGMAASEALEVLREAWAIRRDELLAQHRPGERPGAWWIFDQNETPPGGAAEVERLLELGVMDETEMDLIVADADRHVAACGLAYRIHGQNPRVARGNAVQRFRRLPEWGLQ